MVGDVSLFAVGVVRGHIRRVVNHSWMHLLHSGLVLETLPVLPNVLGSSWLVLLLVDISPHASIYAFPSHGNDMASCPDVGDGISLKPAV